MTIKNILSGFMREVLAEAENNADFAKRLESALNISKKNKIKENFVDSERPAMGGIGPKRAANRRAEAVLDPVQAARDGEEYLKSVLSPLSLSQLHDIVAEFGMDTGKLVMKWKDPERVIERIVEMAMSRSQKGDAFRGSSDFSLIKTELVAKDDTSQKQSIAIEEIEKKNENNNND